MNRTLRSIPLRHPGGGPRFPIARGVAAALLLSLATAASAQAAQAPASAQATEEIFTLRHTRAATALEQVIPLLSANGAIELRQAANALVVRDTPEAIARVRDRLDALDHPVVPLVVDLQIFEGSARPQRGAALTLSSELAARLDELFRFEHYRLVASGRMLTREGENVLYQAPEGFQVRFQAGRVGVGGELRLEAFALERRREPGDWGSLVSGRLRLIAGRPTVLALTRSEDAERALFLAITASRPAMRAQDPGPQTRDRAVGRGEP